MKRIYLVLSCFWIAFSGAPREGWTAPSRPLPRYTFVELGVPSVNTDWVQPLDINNSGEIVGTGNLIQGSDLPVYRTPDGRMQFLDTLPAQSPGGSAEAINHHGQIVGRLTQRGNEGVVWQPNGSITDLDAIAEASNMNFNSANDINESGQVVGIGVFQVTGITVNRALLWSEQTGLLNLGTLPGLQNSRASGINDLGQVVGTCSPPSGGGSRGFIWTQSTGMTALGNLPTDVPGSAALSVNDTGQVLGSISVRLPSGDNFGTAVRWEASGALTEIPRFDFADLQSPLRHVSSSGAAMNSLGQIVGRNQAVTESFDFVDRDFLWDDEWGLLDIRDLIDETGNGWTILGLSGINDLGQIIGWANGPDGQPMGFILNPVPEPESFVLGLACGALMLCWLLKRRRDALSPLRQAA